MNVNRPSGLAQPAPVAPGAAAPLPQPPAQQAYDVAGVAAAAFQQAGKAAEVGGKEMEAKFKEYDPIVLGCLKGVFDQNWTGQVHKLSVDNLTALPLKHVLRLALFYMAVGCFSNLRGKPNEYHEQFVELFKLVRDDNLFTKMQDGSLMKSVDDILSAVPYSDKEKLMASVSALCFGYSRAIFLKTPMDHQRGKGVDVNPVLVLTSELLQKYIDLALVMYDKNCLPNSKLFPSFVKGELKKHTLKKNSSNPEASRLNPFWQSMQKMSDGFATEASRRVQQLREAARHSAGVPALDRRISTLMVSCRLDAEFQQQSQRIRDEIIGYIDIMQLQVFYFKDPMTKDIFHRYAKDIQLVFANFAKKFADGIRQAVAADAAQKKEWTAAQNDCKEVIHVVTDLVSVVLTSIRAAKPAPRFAKQIFEQKLQELKSELSKILKRYLKISSISAIQGVKEGVIREHFDTFFRWFAERLIHKIDTEISRDERDRCHGYVLKYLEDVEAAIRRPEAFLDNMQTMLETFRSAERQRGHGYAPSIIDHQIRHFNAGLRFVNDIQTLFRAMDVPVGVFEGLQPASPK